MQGSGVAPVPAVRAAGQGHLLRVSGRTLSGIWGGLWAACLPGEWGGALVGSAPAEPLVPGHRRGLGRELREAGAEQEVVSSQPAAPGRPQGLPRALVAGRTLLPASLVGQGPRGSLRTTLPLHVCLVGVGALRQAPCEPETGCRTPLLRPPVSTPNSPPSHILPVCVCSLCPGLGEGVA